MVCAPRDATAARKLIVLRVDVFKQLGEFSVDVAFTSEGRVTGLFGSSGAGKTSLVSMIAGLVQPDRGIIAVDSDVLYDGSARIHVPPHRRRIGYVFQDARLFPHLSVAQNLDYGRRMNRLTRDSAEETRITEMLDIGHLLDRRPRHRVRAPEPPVGLLDLLQDQRVHRQVALLRHPPHDPRVLDVVEVVVRSPDVEERVAAQPERLLQARGVASGWKPAAPERGRAETARRLCAKHDSRQDAR